MPAIGSAPFGPWGLARRSPCGRRAVLMMLVAALLFGLGMHPSRACTQAAARALEPVMSADSGPCHGEDLEVAHAACETYCQSDTQSGRVSTLADLPVAAPAVHAALVPLSPASRFAWTAAPLPRDSGPPLHILLHRLLR